MRVKLQLVVCHDDGYEETVTDIITKDSGDHGKTPHASREMKALYLVFRRWELAAGYGYTT